MIIVSQDKEKIINFENIAHIFIENGSKRTISYGKMNGCSETLGYYKTEERAKEVLQEILKSIIEIRKAKDANAFFGFSTIPDSTYYEMPEE